MCDGGDITISMDLRKIVTGKIGRQCIGAQSAASKRHALGHSSTITVQRVHGDASGNLVSTTIPLMCRSRL